jgi:hypothetical protein
MGGDSGPGAAVIEVLARQRIAGQRAGMPGASPIHGRFVSREKVNKLTASEPDGGEEQGLPPLGRMMIAAVTLGWFVVELHRRTAADEALR